MYRDNQDRIDAYLRGEMPQADRAAFERDLTTDDSLHNDYIETKAVVNALADRKNKLDMMAKWDAEDAFDRKITRRRRIIRGWTIGMSAAACAVIGFFAVLPMLRTDMHTTLPDPYFDNDVCYRGGDGSIGYLDSLVKVRDYDVALAYADSLISDCNDEISRYESADTLTESEAYDRQMNEMTLEDLEWRRANILVAMERTDEAEACLGRIVAAGGFYTAQADSLLDVIRKK